VRIQCCGQCGVEFAVYPPERRPDRDHFAGLDEEMYARSVQATREASYHRLLAHVSAVIKGGRWLDVGCSYGWLLKRVRAAGFDGYGVEPSPDAAQKARDAGLKVATGIFPEVAGDGPPYSVVSFMDVLEHVPDPMLVLESTSRQLDPGGVVVIQVPDQSCLLYWLAKSLCRWSGGRLDFALRRLWLTDLDFPHRFYFSRRSLDRLCSRTGFEIIDWYRAAIGAPGQARDRVGYLTGKSSVALPVVSAGVATINALDNLWKHGGLLVVIARPKRKL
jgi:SAM-dependent methyltransferase